MRKSKIVHTAIKMKRRGGEEPGVEANGHMKPSGSFNLVPGPGYISGSSLPTMHSKPIR